MAISRRSAFELIGAGALAGLLADCTKQTIQSAGAIAAKRTLDPTKAHVNLICHGMMLFWYPWTDASATPPDYLYILVPRPPEMPAGLKPPSYHHEIALSQYHGGLFANHLHDPIGLDYRRGEYTLNLGSTFTRANTALTGPPDPNHEVVLKSPGNSLRPVAGSYAEADPVWFRIQIPYPTFVFSYRTYDYSQPAYDAHSQAIVDGVLTNPASIVGVHVFYYEGFQDQVTLQVPGSTTEYIGLPVPAMGHRNIHLYSQPAIQADYDRGHITVFNKMVTYSKNGADTGLQLIDGNATGVQETPTSQPIDGDLDIYQKGDGSQLWDMAEIFDGPKGEKSTQDPVECLQGWGT